MVTYVFWANSIKGLTTDIEVNARNYVEALHKVLKSIATHTEYKHPVRGDREVTGGYVL